MIVSDYPQNSPDIKVKKRMRLRSQAFSISNEFDYYIKSVDFVLRDVVTRVGHSWSGEYSIFESVEAEKEYEFVIKKLATYPEYFNH